VRADKFAGDQMFKGGTGGKTYSYKKGKPKGKKKGNEMGDIKREIQEISRRVLV